MTARSAYRYRALRHDGAVESGALEALGSEDAARLLAGRGMFAVEIAAEEGSERIQGAMAWADVALGLRLLANLLSARLPMDRALAALAESAPPAWQRVLPVVRDAVGQGQSLGAALEGAGEAVPALVVGLVKAGETGGGVAPATERAALLAESVAAMRASLRQALVYPAILMVAGLASLGFLTAVVIPRFAIILSDLGQTPPATTRLVLGAAEAARTGLIPGAVILAIAILALRSWTATRSGRLRWHRLLLLVPVLGRIRATLATARASAAIGALIESGMPLPSALAQGAAACGDAASGAALLRARDRIVQGAAVARALSAEAALTPMALALVRTGEETGQLGAMFREAGRLEQAGAERLVRRAVQLIEPASILFFGALVALVAAALLQALYGVRAV